MNASGGRLSYLGVLRLNGPDALPFLQGQLSNDMQAVRASRSVLAALSSAQGRVLALMRVFARGEDVLALLPRDLLPDTLTHLRKYVMRAKVKLEDASESLAVGGCFGAAVLRDAGVTVPTADAAVQDGDLSIAAVSGDPDRFWLVGPDAALAQRLGWPNADDHFERRWRWQDVQAGLPQVYAATREAFVAQMLNLDLLNGISFTKGCYTGQEIIARTQHLGRIKRRLFRIDLPPGEFTVGSSIRLADGRSARLTEVAGQAGARAALAVLSLEPSGEAAGEPANEAAPAGDAQGAATVIAPPVMPVYAATGR